MPPEPSSPDPLQDLDGPSIYSSTPAPRSVRHRTTSTFLSPQKNKRLSHTTVVSTPTRSPWRIRVVVEAERDDEGVEGEVPASKRARMSKTITTKIPLRGLSPAVMVKEGAGQAVKKKSTPMRKRRKSATATPGGPGKTPAKKGRGRTGATPMLEEEEHVGEGIGPSEDGLEGNDGVSLGPMVTQTKAIPRKNSTPRKAATPRKPPKKRTPASRAPGTVASSSKISTPPQEDSEGEESYPRANTRSALSPLSSNRILSTTPSLRNRSPVKARQAADPPARPLLDSGSSSGSNDDMEGFSMVDTNSLLPDLLNSLSHQNSEPEAAAEVEIENMLESQSEDEEDEDIDLPDFTFMSNGISYTPHAKKKSKVPPAEQQEALFEDDPIGAQSFYGVPEQGKQLFRSSPPPPLQAKSKNATEVSKVTPVLKPVDELPIPEQAQAMKTRKRRRSTPALDHAQLASEGLRSSMGVEESPKKMGMNMRSERFGSVLDQEEQERYAELDKRNERAEEYARMTEEDDYAELETNDGDTNDGFECLELPAPAEKPATYPHLEPELSAGGDHEGKGKALFQNSTPRLAPTAPLREEEGSVVWSSPSSPPKSRNKSVRFVGHENSRNSPSTILNDSIGSGDRTRMLEASWARERAEVSRKAREVGALTIDDDELEEDTIEAERIVADMWEVEAEPRSEDTPAKPRGGRRGLVPESSPMGEWTMEREKIWQGEREEVVKKAIEVGWISIHDTIDEQKEQGEGEQHKLKLQRPKTQPQEQEDQYGAHPASSTTLLNQDTAAFEESLFQREQMHPLSGTLFTSSSTPYKRGSSVSTQQTESSRSSSPPEWRGGNAGNWRRAKTMNEGSTSLEGNMKTTINTTTPTKVTVEIPMNVKDTAMDIPKATTSEGISRTAVKAAALEKGKATTSRKSTTTAKATVKITPKENVSAAEAKSKNKGENPTRPTHKRREPKKRVMEVEEAVEGVNMLTDDLLTPPLSEEARTPLDVLTPPASFTATPSEVAPVEMPVAAALTTKSRRPRSIISRTLVEPSVEGLVAAHASRNTKTRTTKAVPTSPPRVGPIWEKRHWKLLERFLYSSKTVPLPGSRLTYQISIDDPTALGPDYESLLADPELDITTMESGEKALVLRGKEVEAVALFMERMANEGGEVERGWGVGMVAGKVGALKIAGVRRRKRVEGGQKRKDKRVERVVGNERRGMVRREDEPRLPTGKEHGTREKKGSRLSDWL